MKSNPDIEKAHAERLEVMLKPLGFDMVRPGVFAQRQHPWVHFDLSAIDPEPGVVIPHVLDLLWDHAVSIGRRRAQYDFQKAIGNDPGPLRVWEAAAQA